VTIADILRHKGSDVVTIAPDASVTDVIALLGSHNIGALVVVDADAVVGVVSERDVVRGLREAGADLLTTTVRQIMTATVVSCPSTDPVDRVAETMTQRRIRHMPVLDDGRLVGIVSIGDVVLSRIRQLEADRGQLEQYISG
jgi:CBS domain-containing protein